MPRTATSIVLGVLIVAQANAARCDEPSLPNRSVEAIRPNVVVAEFDVPSNGDLIIVPVEIEGRNYPFLMSTYRKGHVIDSPLRALLTPAPKEGAQQDGVIDDIRYEVGGRLGASMIPFVGTASSWDLSELRRSSGREFYGVIGMSFLRTQIVQLDFDTGKLAFLKSVPSNAGASLPLSFDVDDRPMLDVDLGRGEVRSFVIMTGKTGPNAGAIEKDTFERMVTDGRIDVPANHRISPMHGQLQSIQFGEFSERNFGIELGTRNILGLGLLARYRIVFDFPNAQLFLKRRIANPECQQVGNCGFEVCRAGNRIFIEDVEENGAAQEAGLQAGDRLIAVNGKSSLDRSLYELRQILSPQGLRVQVKIERRAKIIEATFVPTPW